ncbi:MAG TPA: FAD-dependent oxidoreductase, partial [Kiloniellales bacterium]|nr:FAD-dependent oxidoreductase [Kiloniellales bacterium]
GPSGFYLAAALLELGLDCEIDFIEALPTPFGLIRGGVAPDHQKTKQVARAFAKTAQKGPVRFFGNVRVGRDVGLDELREIYDAVVIATGAERDRPLGIPGAEKAGVYGSADFVGWYNGHPDFVDLDPPLDTERVCVIGNGNVAIDIARVLVKTPAEMAASDLPDYAAEAIHAAPIEEVVLIGRRGPADAKFTNKELSELGELADAEPLVDPSDLPDSTPDEYQGRDRRLREKNLATLRDFASRSPDPAKGKRVRFLFHAKPVEILGAERVEALRLERTRVEGGRAIGTGEVFEIPCGLVVAAIGYRMRGFEGLPMDDSVGVVANRDGRVDEGLYVVGWAMRGPVGVIGTNKHDGDRVAEHIRADLPAGRKPGRTALEALLQRRGRRWVGFDDWLRIEAAEVSAARAPAPRRKLLRIDDMLALLESEARAVTRS